MPLRSRCSSSPSCTASRATFSPGFGADPAPGANRRGGEIRVAENIGTAGFDWSRRHHRIAAEAQLDGIYVVRTSLDKAAIERHAAVEACKSLARVEHAFRSIKNLIKVRPVFVHTQNHLRAHVFLCMLAYYLQWHVRRRLAPLLFEDDDRRAARAQRKSPVQPARVSPSAKAKADTRRTPDGLPVLSFPDLLSHLATLTFNKVSLPAKPDEPFSAFAHPTPLQQKAFRLLQIDPHKFVASNLAALSDLSH